MGLYKAALRALTRVSGDSHACFPGRFHRPYIFGSKVAHPVGHRKSATASGPAVGLPYAGCRVAGRRYRA